MKFELGPNRIRVIQAGMWLSNLNASLVYQIVSIPGKPGEFMWIGHSANSDISPTGVVLHDSFISKERLEVKPTKVKFEWVES